MRTCLDAAIVGVDFSGWSDGANPLQGFDCARGIVVNMLDMVGSGVLMRWACEDLEVGVISTGIGVTRGRWMEGPLRRR